MKLPLFFVGNKDVTEHRTKAESFCGRMQELNCKTIGVFETQDESELAYQLTVSTLKAIPPASPDLCCNG